MQHEWLHLKISVIALSTLTFQLPLLLTLYTILLKLLIQDFFGSDHLIFTPWLLGERCPVSTTTTRGTIYNLSMEHKRGHFVRALSEGIAYNLRWIIENYEKDFRFKLPSLTVTGGGSQNDHWMQIFADVTKKKIVTTNQPKMAGAIGGAMCAFTGAGIFNDFSSVREIVKREKEFLPNPENFEIYDMMFRDYKNIYASLKTSYEGSNSKRFKVN